MPKIISLSRKNNWIDIFWINKDGSIWTNYCEHFSWGNPQQIAEPGSIDINANIAAISRVSEQIDIFWIGQDGAIWSTHWANRFTYKRNWIEGAYRITDPGIAEPVAGIAAISRLYEHIDVFWIGKDGGAWSTHWANLLLYKRPWSDGCYRITKPGIADPKGNIAAIARLPELIDVFLVGKDGAIWSTHWANAFSYKRNWGANPYRISAEGVAAPTAHLTALARYTELIDVSFVGKDGAIWHTHWANLAYHKRSWSENPYNVTNAGVAAPTAPIATTSRKSNHLDVVYLGKNGDIRSSYWWQTLEGYGKPQAWNDISISSSGIASPNANLSIVASSPDCLHVLFLDNNEIWHSYWTSSQPWKNFSKITDFHAINFVNSLECIKNFNISSIHSQANKNLFHDQVDKILKPFNAFASKKLWNFGYNSQHPIKYLAHLLSIAGYKHLHSLEGFSPFFYFSMRLKVLLELLIHIQLQVISDSELQYISPKSNVCVLRQDIIKILTQEILTDINLIEADQLIREHHEADKDKKSTVISMARDKIFEKIINLNHGEDYHIYSSFKEGANSGHIIYINFARHGSDIIIRIDNLGAKSELHEQQKIGAHLRVKPYLIGCFDRKFFQEKKPALITYVEGVIRANFLPEDDAAKLIYNLEDIAQLNKLSKAEISSQIKSEWPYFKTQTVGNCVIKNRQPNLYFRVIKTCSTNAREVYEFIRGQELSVVAKAAKYPAPILGQENSSTPDAYISAQSSPLTSLLTRLKGVMFYAQESNSSSADFKSIQHYIEHAEVKINADCYISILFPNNEQADQLRAALPSLGIHDKNIADEFGEISLTHENSETMVQINAFDFVMLMGKDAFDELMAAQSRQTMQSP